MIDGNVKKLDKTSGMKPAGDTCAKPVRLPSKMVTVLPGIYSGRTENLKMNIGVGSCKDYVNSTGYVSDSTSFGLLS